MALMHRMEIAANSLQGITRFCHLYDGQEATTAVMEAGITKRLADRAQGRVLEKEWGFVAAVRVTRDKRGVVSMAKKSVNTCSMASTTRIPLFQFRIITRLKSE
ncbi:Pyruvate dehydrogenase E1 component subunit alpha [Vigna angularis]|uniref:Pyruvate dehydrogenase E1 component subunit alpha n=1 Tax=Phaseolus angularis TaxID=3914 RepID=A0A8T0LAW3_PHAAN|nr:Pyruvate dehydrogenase E1 component subunit alpha [Vigna angularis]